MIDKKETLFDRDEKGELVSQEVNLEGGKGTIRITPLTRGEIIKIFSKGTNIADDTQAEIIKNHCKEPSFTDEDIKFMKSGYATAIANTIFKYSGLNIEKEDKQENDELKKL